MCERDFEPSIITKRFLSPLNQLTGLPLKEIQSQGQTLCNTVFHIGMLLDMDSR